LAAAAESAGLEKNQAQKLNFFQQESDFKQFKF